MSALYCTVSTLYLARSRSGYRGQTQKVTGLSPPSTLLFTLMIRHRTSRHHGSVLLKHHSRFTIRAWKHGRRIAKEIQSRGEPCSVQRIVSGLRLAARRPLAAFWFESSEPKSYMQLTSQPDFYLDGRTTPRRANQMLATPPQAAISKLWITLC